MKQNALTLGREKVSTLLLDMTGIALIYFLPALSHLVQFPLYLVEPMRLIVMLALVHTKRANAFFLAVSLPLFSYLVSGHPFILKSVLISIELLSFAWLFFFLRGLKLPAFGSMLAAIVASKILYYLLKAALIATALINTELFSTPLVIQLVVTLAFSLYTLLVFTRRESRHAS